MVFEKNLWVLVQYYTCAGGGGGNTGFACMNRRSLCTFACN